MRKKPVKQRDKIKKSMQTKEYKSNSYQRK